MFTSIRLSAEVGNVGIEDLNFPANHSQLEADGDDLARLIRASAIVAVSKL
jgi:hypothetical protein